MRKAFVLLITLVVMLLLATCVTIYFGGSYKNVEEAISELSGLDISQVDIKKTKEQGKYVFVFYEASNSSNIQLLCLEKKSLSSYIFVGSSQSNNQVDIFQWGSGEELVLVIYGNNEELNASYYNFVYNNKEYSIDITEPYFLDVFAITNTNNSSSLVNGCILYDDKGNELESVL